MYIHIYIKLCTFIKWWLINVKDSSCRCALYLNLSICLLSETGNRADIHSQPTFYHLVHQSMAFHSCPILQESPTTRCRFDNYPIREQLIRLCEFAHLSTGSAAAIVTLSLIFLYSLVCGKYWPCTFADRSEYSVRYRGTDVNLDLLVCFSVDQCNASGFVAESGENDLWEKTAKLARVETEEVPQSEVDACSRVIDKNNAGICDYLMKHSTCICLHNGRM